MSNKFNNEYENKDNENIIEVIDIEEVEIVENNREDNGNYYRKVIDEVAVDKDKKNKKKNKIIVSAAACALVVSFAGGFLVNDYLLNRNNWNKTQNMSYNVGNNEQSTSNEDTNKSEETNKSEDTGVDKSVGKENLSTEEIAKLVSPAVVTVTSTTAGNMFTQAQEGVGTGFIVDKGGMVVTNYHVIEGASKITLTLYDGSEVNAKILRTSKKDDLALLQITDDVEMPGVATLADSDTVNAGQEVVAIGNPLGKELSGTVTKGIISAPKRIITMDGIDKEFMQIDAAINPGNSGGPLINTKGEIIGVNTAKTSGENVEGIGFSVPIKYVRELLENPENYTNENSQSQNGVGNGYGDSYQEGQYPWGGYSEQYPDSYSGNQASNGVTLGVKVVETNGGILVAEVEKGSIAEASGMQANDIIVGVNGVRVRSTSELKAQLNSLYSGQSAELNVQRNGKVISLALAF